MLSERNLSVRMTELVAAVIRPLLANLPERCEEFNRRFDHVRCFIQLGRVKGADREKIGSNKG